MAEYIIDMQGFLHPVNQFVPKEVAIKSLEDGSEFCIIFQKEIDWDSLPASYKSTNSWLIRNYHGIAYDSGTVPFQYLEPILKAVLSKASIIYVKGIDKQKFLYKHVENCVVINLEKTDCPSLKKFDNVKFCEFHKKLATASISSLECSLKNVNSLYTWMSQ